MTLTMMNVGEKPGVEQPTYVMTSTGNEPRARSGGVQKKHVLIAVSVVVVIGLVIAGIMIGMHMFTEAQKEIVKFSMQFKTSDNENAKQDVVSDPNDNVVMYHVTKPGQDVYVVNDFNRDIQVVKLETSQSTNCYISPLNRTQAMDPSQITGPASLTGSGGQNQQPFSLSNTPVSDTSFLTKKARDMCKGVSTYWAYRTCAGRNSDELNITRSDLPSDRNKRDVYLMSPVHGMYGLGGCCWAYWACEVQMTETTQGCLTYYRTGTCCGSTTPVPYCNNLYYQYWSTPGRVC